MSLPSYYVRPLNLTAADRRSLAQLLERVEGRSFAHGSSFIKRLIGNAPAVVRSTMSERTAPLLGLFNEEGRLEATASCLYTISTLPYRRRRTPSYPIQQITAQWHLQLPPQHKYLLKGKRAPLGTLIRTAAEEFRRTSPFTPGTILEGQMRTRLFPNPEHTALTKFLGQQHRFTTVKFTGTRGCIERHDTILPVS